MQVIFQDYYTLSDLIKFCKNEYSSHIMAAFFSHVGRFLVFEKDFSILSHMLQLMLEEQPLEQLSDG